MIPLRSFLQATAGTGALAALGDLGFLAQLPRVSAAEAVLDPRTVRLESGIEPLVRVLEETPRERVIEEVAARVKSGLNYRELLATSLFYFRGSGDPDNDLVQRTRAALTAG